MRGSDFGGKVTACEARELAVLLQDAGVVLWRALEAVEASGCNKLLLQFHTETRSPTAPKSL